MTTLNYNNRGRGGSLHPAFSIPSVLAAVFSILTFTVDGAGHRLIVAILAAVFGAIGVLVSILPGKRGGLVSIASIVIGAIAFIVAIIQALNGLAHS